MRPHKRQPTRLPSLGFSRQEYWSGCHFLLQCMKVKSESEVAQSCVTLSDPMDCSLPGSSIHGFPRQEYWSEVPLPSPIQCLVKIKKKIVGGWTNNSNWKVWSNPFLKLKIAHLWLAYINIIISSLQFLFTKTHNMCVQVNEQTFDTWNSPKGWKNAQGLLHVLKMLTVKWDRHIDTLTNLKFGTMTLSIV